MNVSRLRLAALLAGLSSHKVVLVSEDQDEVQRERIVEVTVMRDECCRPPLLDVSRGEVPAYRQHHNRNSGVAKARRASKKGKR